MSKFNITKLRQVLNCPTSPKRTKHAKKRPKYRQKKKSRKHPVLDNKTNRGGLNTIIRASLFRFINEKLYSCSSYDAQTLFAEDRDAFNIYHEGYRQQLSKWPDDPLTWAKDIILSESGIRNVPCSVADLGCGDGRLALMLPRHRVYSFDLVALNERVTACDISHTPLGNGEVDFAVFCLSLMGTNCRDFVYEANRILKPEGILLIVDVASRFDGNVKTFLRSLKRFGFTKEFAEFTKDTYFFRARLRKVSDCTSKPVSKLPSFHLKPCVYKKR